MAMSRPARISSPQDIYSRGTPTRTDLLTTTAHKKRAETGSEAEIAHEP